MAYEHKPGTFSLFKNDKGENASRPDYRGEGKDLAGKPIEVAAWLKDSAKGKFMSCTFKAALERTQAAKPAQGRSTDDDDMPF